MLSAAADAVLRQNRDDRRQRQRLTTSMHTHTTCTTYFVPSSIDFDTFLLRRRCRAEGSWPPGPVEDLQFSMHRHAKRSSHDTTGNVLRPASKLLQILLRSFTDGARMRRRPGRTGPGPEGQAQPRNECHHATIQQLATVQSLL